MATASGLRPYLSNLNREPLVFSGIVVLLAALFAFTSVLIGKYRDREAALGRDWFQQGQKALLDGRYTDAVDDFQNALVYTRDNQQYRLRLAEALVAANRTQQARAHLLNLLEDEPGDGEVNLELARVAAKDGNLRDAQRYYQGAIYGVWQDDPITHRLNTRFELAELLIAQNQAPRADAELVAIAAGLPEHRPDLRIRLARLFWRAGDAHSALEQYEAALAQQPDSESALAGAGEAAFHEQDYPAAENFLQRAVRLNSGDTHAADLLKQASAVQRMDPFRRGINSTERAKRAVELFRIAWGRLQDCVTNSATTTSSTGTSDPLDSALARGKALQPQVRPQTLRSDPDLLDETVQWAFSAEQAASARCGGGSEDDQAIVLVAKARQKEK